MIKIIHILTTFLYSSFFSHQASSKRPARLDKKETRISWFESFCERVAPYVLFIALVIIGILILVILVKYGHSITGTEANNYEHLTQITTGR